MKMKSAIQIGWSVGQDRYGDETGVYHLIVVPVGSNIAHNACGSKVMTSGMLERDVDGYSKCHSCRNKESSYGLS